MSNFLDIKDLNKDQLNEILSNAKKWKERGSPKLLTDKNIMLIFEKPSLRTRVSFEVCIKQMGGEVNILNSTEFKLGERESVYDTAKVLERYVDMIVIRSFDHLMLNQFASSINIPVINALTDHSHPCQVIADLMTIRENFKNLRNLKISWFGDFNNVTQSWIEASVLMGINFFVACPQKVFPSDNIFNWIKKNNGKIYFSEDIKLVADQADCILTDTWISMGDKKDKSVKTFRNFQVNRKIMDMAKSNAIFMHCLPAHRGMEVSKEIIESQNSVIFDQAENRLHAQKAIINHCFLKK